MKNKIMGIFVCTLLIATMSASLVSSHSIENQAKNLMPSVVDQQQTNTPEKYFLEGGVPHWQQFKNQGIIIEKVDLHIGCYFLGSYPITLSIEETLGTPLTSVTYNATDLPDNNQDWFTFDFPDVKLEPNVIYLIVIKFEIGSEYAWSGSHNDPYTSGGSSHPHADWDFAFKTIVDKKPRAVNTFLINFQRNHLNLFTMLRQLMKLF